MTRYTESPQYVEKTYRWEESLTPNFYDTVSWEEIVEAFTHLKRVFKLPAQACILQIENETNTSYQIFNQIQLVPRHLGYHVLAHEFAHLLVYYWYERHQKSKNQVIAHGDEWLTLYMILLNRMCGHPVMHLMLTARLHNLSFYPHIVLKYSRENSIDKRIPQAV